MSRKIYIVAFLAGVLQGLAVGGCAQARYRLATDDESVRLASVRTECPPDPEVFYWPPCQPRTVVDECVIVDDATGACAEHVGGDR